MIPAASQVTTGTLAFNLGVCLILIALVSAMGIYITAWYKFNKQ